MSPAAEFVLLLLVIVVILAAAIQFYGNRQRGNQRGGVESDLLAAIGLIVFLFLLCAIAGRCQESETCHSCSDGQMHKQFPRDEKKLPKPEVAHQPGAKRVKHHKPPKPAKQPKGAGAPVAAK